jgi:glycosyltransferase involved in cell wall biosynthesis
MGFEVERFSVRRPPTDQLVDDEVRVEAARTRYLLEPRNAGALLAGVFMTALRSPSQMWEAARLAFGEGAKGVAARVRQVAYLLEAALLARELTSRGVDHLHEHSGSSSAWVALLASTLSRIPYSMTIHGMGLLEGRAAALGVKVERSAFTACVTEYGRSQCMIHTPVGAWPKLVVLRCGPRSDFLDAGPQPMGNEPRFVCVGRLSPEKGHMILLDALGELAAEGLDFEMLIIGDGELRPLLEDRISSDGLSGRVRIAGWLDSDSVRGHLCDARALVMPSLSEGLPVAIMEALSLGRPVISTRVGGIPELVEPGRMGWLVAPGSASALADALRDALRAPREALACMGRKGAEQVRRQHDARIEVGRLAELLRSAGCRQAKARETVPPSEHRG